MEFLHLSNRIAIVSVQVCVNLMEDALASKPDISTLGAFSSAIIRKRPPSESRASRLCREPWRRSIIWSWDKSIGRKLAIERELGGILYSPREIVREKKFATVAGQPFQRWLIMQFVATAISCVSRDRLAPAAEEHTHDACTNDATNPFFFSYSSPKSDRANCSSYRVENSSNLVRGFHSRENFNLGFSKLLLREESWYIFVR